VQHEHGIGIAEEIEDAGYVAQLVEATLGHPWFGATGLDELAGVDAEADAQSTGQRPGLAQLVAVLIG